MLPNGHVEQFVVMLNHVEIHGRRFGHATHAEDQILDSHVVRASVTRHEYQVANEYLECGVVDGRKSRDQRPQTLHLVLWLQIAKPNGHELTVQRRREDALWQLFEIA